MKINSINTNNMINVYSKQNQHIKTETINKGFKDKVEISEEAKYLSKINIDNENINLDKVNEIKKRIQEGTYNVSSINIAQKIMNVIKGD